MPARKVVFAARVRHRTAVPIAIAALAFLLLATRPPTAQAYQQFGLKWRGAIALDASQRLEVFVPALDGTVMRTVQDPSRTSGWSGWQALTGIWVAGPNDLVIGAHPVPGTAHGGLLDVFVRSSNGTLWHRLQQSDGSFSAPWESLGGNLTTAPAVVTNADGRLEVFGVMGGNVIGGRTYPTSVKHIWQTTPTSFDVWSGWQIIPGFFSPVYSTCCGPAFIVAALNTTGPLAGSVEVFTPNVGLIQTAPGSATFGLGPNVWMGDSGTMIAATNADGCLEAYGISLNGHPGVYAVSQTHYSCGSTNWTGATQLAPLNAFAYAPAAAARNSSGMLEVFVTANDLAVWHNPQSGVAYDRTQYSGWQSLGVPGSGAAGTPFVAANAYGRLDVFVVGSDSYLWHNLQLAPCTGIHLAIMKCGGWSGWIKLVP